MTADLKTTGIIHVLLVDEATPVWRPVYARKISEDIYEILSDQAVPHDEVWEFQPGSYVEVLRKKDDRGCAFLAATALFGA